MEISYVNQKEITWTIGGSDYEDASALATDAVDLCEDLIDDIVTEPRASL
jgi:hypothetical protein